MHSYDQSIFQASSTSTAGPQPGYCLGTGVACAVCDPDKSANKAFIASHMMYQRHRGRRQGEYSAYKEIRLQDKCLLCSINLI